MSRGVINAVRYYVWMIKSFRCNETEKVFRRNLSRKLPQAMQKVAQRKLWLLGAATDVKDLRVPPDNQLKALKGNRKGQHSVRINRQYRVCFRWYSGNAYDVEIVDYHQEPNMKKLPSIHPGEILLEEFLRPMNISQYRLAKDLSVPARRINEIVYRTRSISANTALRLAKYFGNSPQSRLNLQAHYDLEAERDRIGEDLDQEVRALAVA